MAYDPSAEDPETDPSVPDLAFNVNWVNSIKEAARSAKESAENSLIACRDAVRNVHKDARDSKPEGYKDKWTSRVPCRFFQQGICRNGDSCQMSHDPRDSQPRPLSHKFPEECAFFLQGKCSRGGGCTFAHGQDELAIIQSLQAEKDRFRKLRDLQGLQTLARPGDWRCPGCDALVYASKPVCFRCKRPKPPDLNKD